ncbi:hypothetical protein [Terriglobus roseus]|uniref:Uncharacterized protein n=1 Tax=Terriglobus roseus TaxID=392734 RepID=A0A1G7H9G9_9BACT|nr:hypothetical protein [Terriglobus roseus]SDE96963.1 hypothetical protein SAMN05444167_0974 [Terriglobus roseus]
MRVQLFSALAVVTALCPVLMHAQGRNVPVPSTCSPQVNAKLQTMLQEHPKGYVENVMACGISAGTRVNSGGKHGSHHIITVNVKLPDGQAAKIQIAINDSLDGVVSAKPGDSVFAYGEGYTTGGLWVAGIHDVHCSTHPTADNGWVVVNGNKTPKSCPTRRSRN